MSGVEILSTNIMYNTILPWWCVLIGAVLFVVFVGGFIISVKDIDDEATILCILAMLSSAVLITLGVTSNKNSIDYIEHKVTISDEVSLTEFNEKYEIIYQDGKIYTVKERTNDR